MIDLSAMSMTEIVRLQTALQQELTRRFERHVLLVFSDIVASTPYFAEFGDAAGRQQQQLHLDLLGRSMVRGQGRIVDAVGDGAFLAFASADAAVDALIDFQQAMAGENAQRGRQHQLRVRIGLHWGPVLTDGTAVSGDSVNLCARVAASAEPGHTRLTRAVFQELGRLQRLTCRAIGTVALKGLAAPVELLALEWRDPLLFPRRLCIHETGEEVELPDQDILSFGRWAELEGMRTNDVVLSHPDPDCTRLISRWQFELRRFNGGLCLRALSDSATEVDGALAAKGVDVPVRAGSTIRVAGVLNLSLVGPQAPYGAADDSTMLFRESAPTGLTP